ncbi:DUF2938 family protein [Vibrio viridaestus]|uniref:DUF2938 family protein n=1 Tax=Vibrio viridaestus TaxID=2487322 RepID=A0A3N9TEW3_9VIBR|nr:DUF2938 family protein [Vibrio viridaestus]RQW62771.1 DUF2938 family protein [Vibrio viridaestus]
MNDIIKFCIFVGIGSTLVLDVWVMLVQKVTGIPPTNWSVVGRWLKGLPKGSLVLGDASNLNQSDKVIGWIFHYIIGIAYAVLLILYAGTGFIDNPQWEAVIVIGLVVSTLAGLLILMPGLGAGVLGRKLPNQMLMILYLIIAHAVFAVGQYVFSAFY